MAKTMLINMAETEECRISVVENGHLEEVYFERNFDSPLVGNIYLGKVTNIEPSMQAAFVDFGAERNGFLHISDVCFDMILTEQRMKSLGIRPRSSDEAKEKVENDSGSNLQSKSESLESSKEPPEVPQRPSRRKKVVRKKKVLTADHNEEDQEGKETKEKSQEKKVTRKKVVKKKVAAKKVKKVIRKKVVKKKSKSSSEKDDSQKTTLRKKTEERRHRHSRNGKTSHRKRIRIQDVLSPGQMVIVQVSREAIDKKGATLTTFLSLAGRTLVLMPHQHTTGISRKITDQSERQKLRKLLSELKTPDNMGFIIRTSGIGKTKKDFERDLKVLSAQYEKLKKVTLKKKKPTLLYEEADLAIRALRDVYSEDIKSVVIDDSEGEKKVKGWLRSMIPGAAKRVHLHKDSRPLFSKFGIEEDFENLFNRKVELPSKASLVIEQTEAFVSIDVNTSRLKDKDQNTAIFNTNKEAAVAIPRQLRLRDLGGLIICDFIDMTVPEHKREIERIFQEELKKDRSRVKCSRISQFGLIEVSRQRMRHSVERVAFDVCPTCRGHGKVKNESSVALKILRDIRVRIEESAVHSIKISAHFTVIDFLQNNKRRKILDLEDNFDKTIHLYADPLCKNDGFSIRAFDREGKQIELS